MLDLLFPPRCLGCGARGGHVCARCEPLVGVITPPLCERCGRPAEEPLRSCADCPPAPIDVARAPFLYEGPLVGAIRGLKFSGWRAVAPRLAAAMAEVAPAGAGVVTWVPLSRRRRAARGFDQAEILARALARRLGLEPRRLLRRTRDTPPQARRSASARRSELGGAFGAVGRVPSSVLLVDDVLTTGSTAAVCAEVLKGAGARRVSLLTAARTLGDGLPARCFGPAGTGLRTGLGTGRGANRGGEAADSI